MVPYIFEMVYMNCHEDLSYYMFLWLIRFCLFWSLLLYKQYIIIKEDTKGFIKPCRSGKKHESSYNMLARKKKKKRYETD